MRLGNGNRELHETMMDSWMTIRKMCSIVRELNFHKKLHLGLCGNSRRVHYDTDTRSTAADTLSGLFARLLIISRRSWVRLLRVKQMTDVRYFDDVIVATFMVFSRFISRAQLFLLIWWHSKLKQFSSSSSSSSSECNASSKIPLMTAQGLGWAAAEKLKH